MDITKNVILDLLPLYVANEVSADSRVLIENFLKADPELDNVAKQLAAMEKPGEIPVPLTRDDEMKAYRKANLFIVLIAAALGIGVAVVVFILLMVSFFYSS